ncbi:zinc-dependent alcohol dehydrogenase [Taklimakanibacter deserti]|uniref:zinc-dependent alcohol dehydrogenase n=1 Tax=Taklimakanibacter deserti TaxID=2267839 RepID=UPI000E64AEC7
MKVVRLYSKNDLRVEEIEAPDVLAPLEVRVRVLAAGICGSDIHNFRTGQWISRSPSTAGHEFAGIVTQVGDSVLSLRVGDRVVADSRVVCGRCRNCVEGYPQICEKLGFVGEVVDGGFAEEVVLDCALLHKVDEFADARVLAMAEPTAVALHTLKRLAAPADSAILIVGCGPIGAICGILARHRGHRLLLADKSPDRASLVARITAGQVIDLQAATQPRDLPRFAIDATGSPPVVSQLVHIMPGGGAIALVGLGSGDLSISANLLVEKEIRLTGCHAFNDELPGAIRACQEYSNDFSAILDAEITLDDVPRAYESIIAGRSKAPKTIIRPNPVSG